MAISPINEPNQIQSIFIVYDAVRSLCYEGCKLMPSINKAKIINASNDDIIWSVQHSTINPFSLYTTVMRTSLTFSLFCNGSMNFLRPTRRAEN